MTVHEGQGLINKLPFELHLPGGYQYCGPGTKLQKRIARGDAGINPLDAACKEHDIAYSKTTSLDDRHRADKVLQERAWQRVKSKDAGFGEKAAALLVTGAMKTKRSFGMGMKRNRRRRHRCGKGLVNFKQGIVEKIAKSLKPTSTLKKAAIAALKAAKSFVKEADGRHSVKVPRVIPGAKSGGFLAFIPLFAGLSALGALGKSKFY